MFEVVSKSPDDTAAIGEKIGKIISTGTVICLYGDLGAGKTFFVKNLAKGLGINEEVTSPTFNIMNVYDGKLPLYHFDLYRLEQEQELDDIGFFDYVEEPDGIVVIEWADKFGECLPDDYISLTIEHMEESPQERKLIFDVRGSVYTKLFQEVEGLCQF